MRQVPVSGDPPSDDVPEAVAIVGMAARVPGAANVDAYWDNLRGGVDAITPLTDEDLDAAGVPAERIAEASYVRAAGVLDSHDLFDATLFGSSPREAELLDPQHRLLLENAWAALEDAALDPTRFDGRVGVYAGAGFTLYLLDHVYPRRDLVEEVGAYQVALLNDKDFLATRLAYRLGLEGPCLTVQTACSTSLVAVSLACQALVSGECDAALAGGVSLRLPQRAGYLYQSEGILSPDGCCRAFDADAAGTVPGSGVGVVVLRRLEDALEDGDPIRAVIRGWAVNNDGGEKAGYTAPRAAGQASVIREALALAEVNPETVTMVEAHGTGTRLGDPIEARALADAFGAGGGPGSCALGSVKTMIGHLDAAAGVAGLVKTVLALEHRQIPPSLHFQQPNPEIDFAAGPFYVNTRLRDWESAGPRRAGVSSFGIGGTNAHVVLEEAPRASDHVPAAVGQAAPANLAGVSRSAGAACPTKTSVLPQLMVLSAAMQAALDATGERLARHLEAHPELEAAAVGRTLRLGRRALAYRRFAVCRDLGEVSDAFVGARRASSSRVRAGHRPVAFLFPGQGSQYAAMAGGLYEHLPVFRREIDRVAEVLRHDGIDLIRLLREGGDEELRRTEHAQPAIFAVSWALDRQWRAAGLEPDVLLGHSIGEYVAAAVAGVFELDDAVRLVALRGRLLSEIEGGAVVSVALGEEELAGELTDDARLALAAVNAPRVCAISGSVAAVTVLEQRLAERGVQTRRLRTSHAFHSPAVEPVLGRFREAVAAVERRAPAVPFFSNVTGQRIRAEEATDPDYWARHLRHTVRFAPAVAQLLEESDRVLLEVGPGEVLATLVRQSTGPAKNGSGPTVLSSVRHPQDPSPDLDVLLANAGRLWLAGVELDLESLHPESSKSGPRLHLPTYAFDHQRYWIDPPAPEATPVLLAADVIAKREAMSEWFYVPSWKRTVSPEALRATAATDEDARTWLVVGGGEAGERFVDHLVTGGERAVFAPTELFEERLDELGNDALAGVVDLSCVACDNADVDAGALAAGLLERARLLGKRLHRPLPFLVGADRLFEVTGGESYAPQRSAAAGLARVVSQEYPHLSCRVVDLPDDFVTALDAERGGAAHEALVAWRGSRRWLRTWEPLPLPAPAASPWREGGHYLLTGGLGRFAVHMATHLAERAGARITLIDRAVPGRSEAGELARLRRSATKLLVLEADVTDAAALAGAVAESVSRFGPPAGVFHAAGAPADAYATLGEATAEDLQRHLGPKWHGALQLERALARVTPESPPDFVLLTSSLASVLGGVGLAPFAAADLCLDVAASSHKGWISVGWEGWQRLWAEGEEALVGQEQNAFMMTPEEVAAACERVLSLAGEPHVAVATADLEARLALWTNVREARAATHTEIHASDADYRAPSNEVEAFVAELWQRQLGVERVGADDDFFALGGSSLVGLQILSEMRSTWDVELPLRSFFEARTVAAMAELVGEERARADEDEARLEAMLAEVEDLADEDVAALLEAEEHPSTPTHDTDSRRVSERRPEDGAQPNRLRGRPQGARSAFEYRPQGRRSETLLESTPDPMRFSLFFFSADGTSEEEERYRLLLDAARFADRRGFEAVWTPERHFVDFGGLYPNPSVLGAALAVATERIRIRSGSVVLPLHHPVRIAEEWAVVDNLSGGRVDVAGALGWHPTDFVLRPESYPDHREVAWRTLDALRRLWAGEAVEFETGDGGRESVRSLPRPVQPRLPLWITSSGNPETWRRAGEAGTNVLTSFGVQTFEELEKKVSLYRDARRRASHAGPGVVSVMVHTFLGEDLEEVKEKARAPLSEYLRTHLAQHESFLDSPAVTDADKEALLPLAFEHYVSRASLLGTLETSTPFVNHLARAGVDEVACLVDFGLPYEEVITGLDLLAELLERHRSPGW